MKRKYMTASHRGGHSDNPKYLCFQGASPAHMLLQFTNSEMYQSDKRISSGVKTLGRFLPKRLI